MPDNAGRVRGVEEGNDLMRQLLAWAALGFVFLFSGLALADTPNDTGKQIGALQWVQGPAKPGITERASIALPADMMYLDAAGTAKFLELTGNLPEENSYTIAPKDLSWFAVFDFSDIGYVKDDEKIDAAALLKTMQENQTASNEERKSKGLDNLTIKGWSVVPHYDAATHNLEYGMTLVSGTGENVNYSTRVLGRKGVMNAMLITSSETLPNDLKSFRSALAGFSFAPEEGYAAYKDGGKISEYGLAALVTGGAAAAAVKVGLFKGLFALLAGFWKLIAVGVVAFFGAFRSFFGRLLGRGDSLGPPPEN
jgi:uncharacterized membrane-anchored protein